MIINRLIFNGQRYSKCFYGIFVKVHFKVHHGVWFNEVYQTYHNYEVWAPHDFNFDSKDKKYPVLLEVYAGPEFQKVQATFKRSWPQVHLPAAYDCLTVSMDGRGSAFQGDKFTFANYRALRFEN